MKVDPQVPQTTCRTSAVRPRDQEDPHDDAHPEGENSAKRYQRDPEGSSIIIQVIKTYWELGHEHKFITEIVARRANECIMSITEPDYKNLNKNDIVDIYLLIMNDKVPDCAETGLMWSLSVFIRSLVIWERVHDFQLGIESYQQKVNLTAPTISFPGIAKHKMLQSEDPNQHLKDFLKLVDSLDLDGENRERTRLRLFQFSLRDQARNWLERLPPRSITTWEDPTT
ncbi:hypothetical protein Tco_1531145 [Tanacetum coccineum]